MLTLRPLGDQQALEGFALSGASTHEKGPKGSIGTGNGPNDASTQERGSGDGG